MELHISIIGKEILMPVVIMRAKLEKSYEHWVSAFDGNNDAREAAGFKVLYRGHELNDPTTIHVVQYTPSVELIGKFMKENADVIKEAGHIPESTEVTICTDM
jgi:hypothetical protein